MKITFKILQAKAAELGATVEERKDWDNSVNIEVIAPDGKQWISGQCLHMLAIYWTYEPNGRTQAIRELYHRIGEGLEPLDESINPQ